LHDVKEVSENTGATFVDMYDPNEFPDSMFLDSNHMNGTGSVKFWDLLVPKIAATLAAALEAPTRTAAAVAEDMQRIQKLGH
jgi:hypothetical protein